MRSKTEWVVEFQPTPPRGRRQDGNAAKADKLTSFNPRLRAGGDQPGVTPFAALATFQPTPPRGRRHAKEQLATADFLFQPTPPRGRRRPLRQEVQRMRDVSTHASAREATWKRVKCVASSMSFNPRLRAGGDSLSAEGLSRNCLAHSFREPALPRGFSGVVNA